MQSSSARRAARAGSLQRLNMRLATGFAHRPARTYPGNHGFRKTRSASGQIDAKGRYLKPSQRSISEPVRETRIN
jgi:hypothetical protein